MLWCLRFLGHWTYFYALKLLIIFYPRRFFGVGHRIVIKVFLKNIWTDHACVMSQERESHEHSYLLEWESHVESEDVTISISVVFFSLGFIVLLWYFVRRGSPTKLTKTDYLLASWYRARAGKLDSWAKSCSRPVFANKDLLEHSHAHVLAHCL